MEISKMTMDEIEARMAEIKTEAENEDLTEARSVELSDEVDALEARKAEIIAEAEARKAEADEIIEERSGKVIEEHSTANKEEGKMFGIETTEYRDAFMKNLMGKEVTAEERTALTSAGAVVPTATVNKIYGKLMESPLYAELGATHLAGYMSIPQATTVNDAAWTAMGTAATDSADVIGTVSLGAYKLIKTIEITADIDAMSIDAFESWLVNKLTQKMLVAICASVIVGTGTGQPTGITKTVSASALSANTVATLSALMGGVGSAYHAGAVWIMSSADFYSKIVPLAQDNNGVVVTNGIQPMLLGHKVVFDDAAAGKAIFGNLADGYAFNFGREITIDKDTSVGFRTGSACYRAMCLADGKVVDADAFAVGTLA